MPGHIRQDGGPSYFAWMERQLLSTLFQEQIRQMSKEKGQIQSGVCYIQTKEEDWKLQRKHSGTLIENKLYKL